MATPPSEAQAATVTHSFANPLVIAKGLGEGLSLYRCLFYSALSGLRLGGRVLDLGGKSEHAPYYRHIQLEPDASITSTDLNARPGVLSLDVEEPFPVSDEAYDTVLAFNLFEHVFRYQRAPAEVHRVLRPGGRFVICVPFLHEYHADPHDYFRFTAPALKRIWEEPGMQCVQMSALGEGVLTYAITRMAALVTPRPVYRVLAPVLYLLAMPLDRLVALRPKLDGLTMPARFPLGYYAIFEKNR